MMRASFIKKELRGNAVKNPTYYSALFLGVAVEIKYSLSGLNPWGLTLMLLVANLANTK